MTNCNHAKSNGSMVSTKAFASLHKMQFLGKFQLFLELVGLPIIKYCIYLLQNYSTCYMNFLTFSNIICSSTISWAWLASRLPRWENRLSSWKLRGVHHVVLTHKLFKDSNQNLSITGIYYHQLKMNKKGHCYFIYEWSYSIYLKKNMIYKEFFVTIVIRT